MAEIVNWLKFFGFNFFVYAQLWMDGSEKEIHSAHSTI
jgi:hypothetical protein